MNIDLVSIIIPTYSRPENLCRAIDSALSQNYNNIEIIVVDDNGENSVFQLETEKVLNKYIESGKVTYLKHLKNLNGSAARNTGFRASHGQYINYLDDDDVLLPDKISEQLSILKSRDSTFGACYCNSNIRGSIKNRRTQNVKEGNLLVELLSGVAEFNTSSLLFKREVIELLNGFDERYLRCQDWELMTRFFRSYKVCLAKTCLIEKHSTSNIVTSNPYIIIQYREFFLRELDYDIQKSGGKDRIYSYFYATISISLLANGLKKDGVQYFIKACGYKLPSLFAFVKFMYFSVLPSRISRR